MCGTAITRKRGYRLRAPTVGQSLNHAGSKTPDNWQWKGACWAALEAYRKLPHTSTGECPLFLATGQDPTYTVDHLLPTVPREMWQTNNKAANLDQLTYAHALARRNTVLARLKNKDNLVPRDVDIKPGDRVYKQNMRANKLDPRWLTGYRVIRMQTSRTAVLRHDDSDREEFVNVRHIRKSSPVSELLQHVGTAPKLYLRLEDLPDLNWPAITSAMGAEEKDAATETSKQADEPLKTTNSRRDVPQRERRRPARFDSYVF